MKYLVKFTDSNIENIALNICIFLFGINFLYKCNYIVLATFVLLFIFKKFKINYGNIFTLIILSLFAVSWYIFTDGHEIAGICLPICYLIGCNVDKEDDKGTIKFILLVATSLALYTTLFFVNNAIKNGITSYDVNNQPNIWTGRPLWATNIMLYSSLFFSCFGYVVFTRLNRKIEIAYFVIAIVNSFYALMLSRRAALLMIMISIIVAFMYKLVFEKKQERAKTLKIIIMLFGFFAFALIIFSAAYKFNILQFKNIVKQTDLYTRFIGSGDFFKIFNDMGRSMIRGKYFEHFWEWPWGASRLHEITGYWAHDLWLDVYDAAGIFSLIIIIIYTAILFYSMFKVSINKHIKLSIRIMFACIAFCVLAQFSIEPILEACRAYMFGVCMIHGSIESIKKKEND